jgi:mRNA interferase MazF
VIQFPFAEARAAKTRPALVVNDPGYEAETGNLIIAQITSQAPRFSSDYPLKGWKAAGLVKPSIVRLKLATLASSLVRYRPGKISPAELAEVDARLRKVLGLKA